MNFVSVSRGYQSKIRTLIAATFLAVSPRYLAAQRYELHPTQDQLRRPSDHVIEIGAGRLALPTVLQPFVERMRSLQVAQALGSEDEADQVVFGAIAAVSVDHRGRLLVLDRAMHNLRVSDVGRMRWRTIGQQGSGPLDFRAVMAMAPLSGDSIMVGDGVLGLKVIRTAEPARLLRRIPVATDLTSACVAGTSYVVLRTSGSDGKLLTAYDERGAVKRHFGFAYPSRDPLVRTIMSEGVVGCMADGSVVAALSGLPFIEGYDAMGKKRWTARLSAFDVPYQELRTEKSGLQSIGLTKNIKMFSYVSRIVPVGRSAVLVQVVQHTRTSLRARKDFDHLDTYVVDVKTGNGAYVNSTLPPIGHVSPAEVIGFSNDPFPRALVMRSPRRE